MNNLKEYESMTAIEKLNYFRNCYYTDGNNTENGIIANAINEILPIVALSELDNRKER